MQPRAQCFKSFYSRNLQMSLKRLSACPWHTFPALSNVCLFGQ
jgi:hypothetical protein